MRKWVQVRTSMGGWLKMVQRFLLVGDGAGLADFEAVCVLSAGSARTAGLVVDASATMEMMTGCWRLWLEEGGSLTERGACVMESLPCVELWVDRDHLGVKGEGYWRMVPHQVFGVEVVENGLSRDRVRMTGLEWENACWRVWEEFRERGLLSLLGGDAEFKRWMGILGQKELGVAVDGWRVGLELASGERALKGMHWFEYGAVREGKIGGFPEEIEGVLLKWLRVELRCWSLWALVARWSKVERLRGESALGGAVPEKWGVVDPCSGAKLLVVVGSEVGEARVAVLLLRESVATGEIDGVWDYAVEAFVSVEPDATGSEPSVLSYEDGDFIGYMRAVYAMLKGALGSLRAQPFQC